MPISLPTVASMDQKLLVCAITTTLSIHPHETQTAVQNKFMAYLHGLFESLGKISKITV